MAFWTLTTLGMDFCTVAATGRCGASHEAGVADLLFLPTGAPAQPEGVVGSPPFVGQDRQAGKDLACQVVVARKGWVFELIFGHIKQL